MQRPAHSALGALPIEAIGDLQRVRVDLDDAAQHRTMSIDLVDAFEVRLGELAGAEFATSHP